MPNLNENYRRVRAVQRQAPQQANAVTYANAGGFRNPPKGADVDARERWAIRWLALYAESMLREEMRATMDATEED